MSTPEMTTPSNSPNIQSTAEAVLAEATAIAQGDATYSEPERAVSTPEETVEIEDTDTSGSPRKRNLSWNDAIKQVPPDIANLMREMQADYTRKTQEVSEQKKDILREREALLQGTKLLEEKEVPEYDPFNEESIRVRIENEVSRRLREVLEPMEQEYKVMQAEDSYKAFLSEHPEFQTDQTLRAEVQNLLETNGALDLETAYWAAKGKQTKAKASAQREAQTAKRKAAKQAAKAVAPARRGRAVRGNPKVTRSMTNEDILSLARELNRNG